MKTELKKVHFYTKKRPSTGWPNKATTKWSKIVFNLIKACQLD